MQEEDEGIHETVELKETCKKGAKDLHTLPDKGTCCFPMLDIASNLSSQEHEGRG